MNEEPDWSIEFFADARGRRPVRDFIDALDAKTQARFRWSLEQLRSRNVRAREPLARPVEGDIWEVREESSTNIYRVLYFFYTGRRIVLLHGFQKKTQRTPRREIEAAKRNRAAFLEQQGRS